MLSGLIEYRKRAAAGAIGCVYGFLKRVLRVRPDDKRFIPLYYFNPAVLLPGPP
jgi:hypothetical protein